MENLPLVIFSRLCLFILVVLWMYFFIYSYRHKVVPPWGFSIVIVGILVSGIGYRFYNNQVMVFSINLSLIASLIGMLWNISNIRKQFYIRDLGEFLRFIGIGLISGLVFGFVIISMQGIKYIQVGSQYTVIALITISIQASMAEEFLFRGYLLNYLRKYEFNQIIAVVFQALMFTVLHIPRYSSDWMAIVIIFLVGVTAGYLTWKNDNLVSAFVLHIVANLMTVILWLVTA